MISMWNVLSVLLYLNGSILHIHYAINDDVVLTSILRIIAPMGYSEFSYTNHLNE